MLDYGQMHFRERVNAGRLHSLVLETQLYIFARQCALNLELKKPAEVARSVLLLMCLPRLKLKLFDTMHSGHPKKQHTWYTFTS